MDKGTLLFTTAFLLIIITTFYSLRMELYDRNKLKDIFDQLNPTSDTTCMSYLSYLQIQPVWRMSFFGALIIGLFYYIFHSSISATSSMDKIPGISTIFIMIISFTMINSIASYRQFHNICPNSCVDPYE